MKLWKGIHLLQLKLTDQNLSFILSFFFSAIRSAASRTCTSILARADQSDRKIAAVVNEVVEKLLIVGISDPGTLFFAPLLYVRCCRPLITFLSFGLDPLIRETVLACLGSSFQKQLAEKPENLRSLFIALNDTVFAVCMHHLYELWS